MIPRGDPAGYGPYKLLQGLLRTLKPGYGFALPYRDIKKSISILWTIAFDR
jgi:hypothetical protein